MGSYIEHRDLFFDHYWKAIVTKPKSPSPKHGIDSEVVEEIEEIEAEDNSRMIVSEHSENAGHKNLGVYSLRSPMYRGNNEVSFKNLSECGSIYKDLEYLTRAHLDYELGHKRSRSRQKMAKPFRQMVCFSSKSIFLHYSTNIGCSYDHIKA